MADYNVHFEFGRDARGERPEPVKVPYFCLPASELTDVIADSCYSCFDYANSLADLVVGYMAVPYAGGSMRSHLTSVTVRNDRGAEMWEAVRGKMEVAEAVSSRDFLRPAFVKATMTQDDEARFQGERGERPETMPLPVGRAVAGVMSAIGPLGVAFARYSVDYVRADRLPPVPRSRFGGRGGVGWVTPMRRGLTSIAIVVASPRARARAAHDSQLRVRDEVRPHHHSRARPPSLARGPWTDDRLPSAAPRGARTFGRRARERVPAFAQRIIDEYNADGYVDALLAREEEAG